MAVVRFGVVVIQIARQKQRLGHNVFGNGGRVGTRRVEYRHATLLALKPIYMINPGAGLGDGAQWRGQRGRAGGADQAGAEGDVQARLEHAVSPGPTHGGDQGRLVMTVDLGIVNARGVVLPDAVCVRKIVQVEGDGQAQLKKAIDFLKQQRRAGGIEYQGGKCHTVDPLGG